MKGALARLARRLAISVLPTPVGTHHQNVFRRDLVAQFRIDLHTPPAVAEGDRHRPLGVTLADDVLVELLGRFSRGVICDMVLDLRHSSPGFASIGF